jgi:nicotinamide-nucleotide amidase
MNVSNESSIEARLVAACAQRGLTVATAESCTGGLVSARITSVPGSSAVFSGGVVSYANEAKRDLLGVPQELLGRVGAVSAECAEVMAAGVRERLKADVAVSVTGIAGPGGGTPQKPVGLVYLGVSTAVGARAVRCLFDGDREAVRRQAADRALELLLETAHAGLVGRETRCGGDLFD